MLRNEERRRRNSKLESFMKRTLPNSLHEDVRWYESVIVRQGDILGYKHLIVTGDQVYVTDTQPRSLTCLFNISQISRVYMVHDLPEFLGGGLRERTTHTVIALRGKSRQKTSPTSSTLNGDDSITNIIEEGGSDVDPQSPPIPHSSKKERKFGKAGIILRRRSQDSIDSKSEVEDSDTVSAVGPVSECNGTKGKEWVSDKYRGRSFENGLTGRHRYKRNSLPSTKSPNSEEVMSIMSKISLPDTRVREKKSSNLRKSPPTKENFPLGGDNYIQRRDYLPQRPENFGPRGSDVTGNFPKSRSLSPAMKDLLDRVAGGRPNSSLVRSVTPEPQEKYSIRSLSAMETYSHEAPLLTLNLPTRSRSVLDKPISLQRSVSNHRRKSLNGTDSIDGSNSDQEIHLYTLSRSTVIFNLIHSFWMSSLVNETIVFDINGRITRHSNHISGNNNLKKEPRKLEKVFNQLLEDIIQSDSLEDQFSLIQELYQGVAKYPQVKRIFWKDNEMLQCLRNILSKYTHKTSLCSDNLQDRQDEIEIIVLLLNTIAECFKDTQMCSWKLKVLSPKDTIKDLIRDVTQLPNIPGSYNSTCSRWLTDFREYSSKAWENLPESELLRLVQEAVISSTVALYWILQTVQELSWGMISLTPDLFNVSSSYILFENSAIESWVKYAIPQFLCFIASQKCKDELDEKSERSYSIRDEYLTGKEMVLLHQSFVVLKYVLENNSAARVYCTKNYFEELRYYLQEKVLGYILHPQAPLRGHILTVASQLNKMVTRRSSQPKYR